MAKTLADQFADTLAAAGVKRIYGIVDDSLNGLTDALRRQGKIEWIHVWHQEVAGFGACGEAHLTGELAVCAGSCSGARASSFSRSYCSIPRLVTACSEERCARRPAISDCAPNPDRSSAKPRSQ